jgi:hypothetical protein
MTAVVSGAVVLAQSGQPRPVPALPESRSPRIATPRSDQDERGALEKKLDRVLEALERLSKTNPPPAPMAVPGTVTVPHDPAAPTALEPAIAGPAPATVASAPETDEYGPPAPSLHAPPPPAGPFPPARMPLATRLEALEKQMQQVQQRLERLETQLKALDARVGGGGEEGSTQPRFLPNPLPRTR